MSRRSNETDYPKGVLRLTEDSASEKQSTGIGTEQPESVCKPINGAVHRTEHSILRPLTKVRDSRLLIRDIRGRMAGGMTMEECSPYSQGEQFTDANKVVGSSNLIYASAEHNPDDPEERNSGQPKVKTSPSSMRDPEDPMDKEITEPSESGERVVMAQLSDEDVLDVRGELELALDVDEQLQEEESYAPVSAQPRLYDTLSPPKYKDPVEVEQVVLERMSELLKLNTLQSSEEAMELLKGSGLLAVQRWEEIHSNPESRHNFSRVSKNRVNSFARRVLDRVDLDEDSLILELGSGFGNDAMHFARKTNTNVIGVDSSQAAITKAQSTLGEQGLRGKVNLTCHDFLEVLEQSRGMNLDMVYSHSTLHYSPPLILRERTFPLIADVLRSNGPGTEDGKLCFAMKTGASASAKSSNQHQLLTGDPYNASVDMHDKVFRIYPESKDDILALLEPSFDVDYARVVPVKGYDKNGDVEMFCYVIATPKAITKKD